MFEKFERKLMQMQQVNRPVLSKEDSVIYWQHVISVILTFREVVFLRKPLKLLSTYYLDQLLEVGCSDFNLARAILQMYALSLSSGDENYKAKKKTVLKRLSTPSRDGVNRRKRYRKENSEMIELSMDTADEKFSRALVYYEVRCSSCYDITVFQHSSAISAVTKFLYCISKYEFEMYVREKQCGTIAKSFVYGLLDDDVKVDKSITWSFHRILFAIRVIKALTLKRYKRRPPFEEYLDCVRLHYGGEPFLTTGEFNTFIRSLFTRFRDRVPEGVSKSFSQDYEVLSVHYGELEVSEPKWLDKY